MSPALAAPRSANSDSPTRDESPEHPVAEACLQDGSLPRPVVQNLDLRAGHEMLWPSGHQSCLNCSRNRPRPYSICLHGT